MNTIRISVFACAASAALRLGRLEFRAGETDRAAESLKQAIALNASDAKARAEAYLLLADNAGAQGDWKSACAYATVVTSLFDDADLCAAAKKILEEHACAQHQLLRRVHPCIWW